MAIDFLCSGCGEAFSVPESLAGKRAKCESCGTIVQVPHPSETVDLMGSQKRIPTHPTNKPTPVQPAQAQPLPAQPNPQDPFANPNLVPVAPIQQAVPAQPMQAQPIPGQPMQAQPIPGQPMQAQPIPGQPMQAQPIPVAQ